MSRRMSWDGMLAAGLVLLLESAAGAQGWTEPVEVRSGMQRCVAYQARLQGEYLVIEAMHEPSWHTYAMDNPRRAQEKLAGREPLGIELPTSIELGAGLQAVGPWYQSPPKDLSQPEIQWYTWGFDNRARFVVQVRRTGAAQTELRLKGQACDSSTCVTVDVVLPLKLEPPGANNRAEKPDLEPLVVVAESQ